MAKAQSKTRESPIETFFRDNVALIGLGALIAVVVIARKSP